MSYLSTIRPVNAFFSAIVFDKDERSLSSLTDKFAPARSAINLLTRFVGREGFGLSSFFLSRTTFFSVFLSIIPIERGWDSCGVDEIDDSMEVDFETEGVDDP